MKICLIVPPSPFLEDDKSYPPMGLLYVASSNLSMGHEIELVDLTGGAKWSFPKADIYGITCSTPNVNVVNEIIEQLDCKPSRIIVGGAHPTYYQGDSFVGLQSLRGHIRDVEYILPARDLIDWRSYRETTVYTSFGCRFRCSFCCHSNYLEIPLSIVKDDIDYVIKRGVRHINFGDDNININPSRLKKIMSLIPDGITFRLNMDSRNITTGMLDIVKSKGCVEISIGIESGSQKMLDAMDKRVDVETNIGSIKAIKDAGIKCKIYLVSNFPGETEYTIDETIKFLQVTNPDKVLVSNFAPLPGCDVYYNPDKYGITWMSDNWDDYYLVGRCGSYGHCFETEQLTREKQAYLHDLLVSSI